MALWLFLPQMALGVTSTKRKKKFLFLKKILAHCKLNYDWFVKLHVMPLTLRSKLRAFGRMKSGLISAQLSLSWHVLCNWERSIVNCTRRTFLISVTCRVLTCCSAVKPPIPSYLHLSNLLMIAINRISSQLSLAVEEYKAEHTTARSDRKSFVLRRYYPRCCWS